MNASLSSSVPAIVFIVLAVVAAAPLAGAFGKDQGPPLRAISRSTVRHKAPEGYHQPRCTSPFRPAVHPAAWAGKDQERVAT